MFELSEEQKRADIKARITAALSEIRPILAKYDVEITAVMEPLGARGLMCVPDFGDTKYRQKAPPADAAAKEPTPPAVSPVQKDELDKPTPPTASGKPPKKKGK